MIIITGAAGMIGSVTAWHLNSIFGENDLILCDDLAHENQEKNFRKRKYLDFVKKDQLLTSLSQIDAKKIDDHYEVFTHGGRNATGINAIEWAKKMADFGAGELLITSMDRDGTKTGFDNNLMKSISDAVDIPIIASGGAGSLRHLVDGIKEGEADAVLAASIFHYGEYSIKEAKKYMHEHGIEMRL